MSFKIPLVFILILLPRIILAQCTLPEFTVGPSPCAEQPLSIQSTVAEPLTFEWDFCDGSIVNQPAGTVLSTLSGAQQPNTLATVFENNRHYTFITDVSGHLFRVELDDELQSVISTTDLGVFAGVATPRGFYLFEENDERFALIANNMSETSVSITRLSFGDSYLNTPTASQIPLTDLTDIRQIKIVRDAENIYAIMASGGAASPAIVVLNFGSSISNSAIVTSHTVTGGNFLTGLSIINDCGNWFVFVEGYGSGIHRLSFGDKLSNIPSTVALTPSVSVAQPLNISVVKSAGNFYAFVPVDLENDKVLRLDFGNSITNTSPEVSEVGTFSTNLAIGAELVKVRSKYHWLGINFLDNQLIHLDFPKDCNIEDNFFGQSTPEPMYGMSGTFDITLTASDGTGKVGTLTRSVTIAPPDIDIVSENVCVDHEVNFTSENNIIDIISYTWNFGDSSPEAVGVNPSHVYNEIGEYLVRLDVVASNMCTGSTFLPVKIYDPPIATFNSPSGILCTNGELLFTNNTPDNFEGFLEYEWYVNGDFASSSRDLAYTFESTGIFDVKLRASLPGCFHEYSQSTNQVNEGPTIAFSIDGSCEGELLNFKSEISAPVTTYEWTFGDGNSSSEQNPEHVFNSDGDFQISLTAITESGCNSVVTENITVHPQPNPDFTIELQPVYCTNISLNFTGSTPDTDDPIQLATWNFNDGSDPSSGMAIDHQFENAGTYDVSFETTTQPGCSNTIVKQLTVYPTPDIEFTNTAACVGVPVDFTPTPTGTISTWQWQINDKSYSDDQPTHIFRTPGVYDASVTVTDINGCAASLSEVVSVPDPLDPDFAVLKNCVNENAVFTDITDQGDDPIASWTWQVDEEPALTGNPLAFVFSKAEEIPVTLNVVTESGCSYFVSKNIEVMPFPKASFTMSSEIGSPPFPVNFTNHSEDASDYAWDFGDGNISNEASPAHEYTEVGEFTITLTASNPEGCAHSSTKEISISPAQPDIRIMAVTATENPDKTIGIMVTLQNDGNTIIYDLPLDIDISGTVQVREIIEGPVLPRSRVNFSLGYGVNVTETISFLCATATLAGDVEQETNRNCVEFASEVVFLPGYPNPAKEFLQIEWVAPQEETVRASLRNLLGNEIWTLQFSSEKGLNQKTVEVQNLQKGIYMLILESPRVTTMQRILIAR